jgi:large subunit ribosomal protein L9
MNLNSSRRQRATIFLFNTEVIDFMSEAKHSKGRGRFSKRLPTGPHGGIELLLVQSVEHLGHQGDVVEVKPGYAQNYLLPQGLATFASEHHKRMVEKHRARLLELDKARHSKLLVLAEELARQSITIEANANDEGHLYGSVGAAEIVNALKRLNITLHPEQVRLTGPLKELGLYTVKVHLGQEIEGDLKVWVVPAVGQDEPAPASAPKQA